MKYNNAEILANVKTYSQYTLDDEGNIDMHHYDFEVDSSDIISYTTDKYPDVECDTVAEIKKFIDEQGEL